MMVEVCVPKGGADFEMIKGKSGILGSKMLRPCGVWGAGPKPLWWELKGQFEEAGEEGSCLGRCGKVRFRAG